MDTSNELINVGNSTTSKRVRVKRSMLVEQSDDGNKIVKPVQDSNDYTNDITFTEDCDFVNRLRQNDSKANPSTLQVKYSPRTSPVPRYMLEDPPSWLGSRQNSDSASSQLELELDVALGLKSTPQVSKSRDVTDGSKSVPLSPFQNAHEVEKMANSKFQSNEPSSARALGSNAADFEKSLKSDVTFYPSPLDSKDGEALTTSTSSKRRQRRSETSTSLSDPSLNQPPGSSYTPRNVHTANSNGAGSSPPTGAVMWGGSSITTTPDVDPESEGAVNRRKGSWLDSSPKSAQQNPKPVVTRTQMSPRDLSPLCEPRSARMDSGRRSEYSKANQEQAIEAAVAAVDTRWRAKFEAALLEAKNAKAALLEARSKINQQTDRIMILEAELARMNRLSPQKQDSSHIVHHHHHHEENVVTEESSSKGGVAFDIQVGKQTAPRKSVSDAPPQRDLMARLGMSASQRRMLAVVQPDAKLSRVLQGDDALPSALPSNQSQQGDAAKHSSPSRGGSSATFQNTQTHQQRAVTWQSEAGDVSHQHGAPPSQVPLYRTMSGRYFSDGKTAAMMTQSSPVRPRCATCGVTSGLEADEDNPGTYYCVKCWEDYENEDGDVSKSLKPVHGYVDNTMTKTGSGVTPNSPLKSPISMPKKIETKEALVLPSPRSPPPVLEQITSHPPLVKTSFAGRCFILSDNTHLLNQVALLLSKGTHQSSGVTALVETKGSNKKVRIIAAQVVTVGCCHAVGSIGADLGTDVIVARTPSSTDSGLLELDGSRGSMFIELASMYGFEKDVVETQQETNGDFKGFRMNHADGIPLDGRVMDKPWISKAEKMLDIKITNSNQPADISWWMSNENGRIDVILAPQHKGDWYPMWEISSGRRMAPQFRSSGVGYLRLADDMGSNGNSFISVNGKSYLGEAGFDEASSPKASPLPSGEALGGVTSSARRRRSEFSDHHTKEVSDLGDAKTQVKEAKEALTALRAGCGGAGGSDGELKWKDKTELLRKATSALMQVCSLVARSTPGGVLPMAGTSANAEVLQAKHSNCGYEEAVNGISVAQRVLGDRGKNVHVLSGALALLKASGMLCGDRCPATPTWRVLFPQLLTLFRDSSKVVANAATETADALHLRCFRVGDSSSLGFIIAELQLLSGKTSSAKGGKAPRAISAAGMVGWLLRALNRENTVWNQGGEGLCIGSMSTASDTLASAILPLLTHREIDTRDLSAQALATVLLSTEAHLSSRGGQVAVQSQGGHLSLLVPLNASDPKAYAKVVGYISEGRKRGEHLPTRKTPIPKPVSQTRERVSPPRANRNTSSPNSNENSEMSSLRRLWGQIVYVLRKPVGSASDLDHLGRQAALGSTYLRTLSSTANALGLRKGALSRAVLPFDDQTSLADQSNLGNRKTRSLEAVELLKKGQLKESVLDSMQVDAVKLRALLRVKIADDADLDQANAALEDIQLFLRKLSATASNQGVSSFDLLQTL